MQIKIENLAKHFQDASTCLKVIDRLSFEFPENSSIAIIGKSGIGKSTLLYLLGGLVKPTTGSINFGTTDLTKLNPDQLSSFRGRNMGFVFQFHHLLPEFTAQENVAMPLLVTGTDEGSAMLQAREALVRLELGNRLTHLPGQLSGGEQQRVAIARAVVGKPAVLLADEPTGNLDEQTGKKSQDILVGLQRDLKNTLIVVTHNVELAANLDFTYEMHSGGQLTLVRESRSSHS